MRLIRQYGIFLGVILLSSGCGSALEDLVAPDADKSSSSSDSKKGSSKKDSGGESISGEASSGNEGSSSSGSSSGSSNNSQFFDSINGIDPSKNFTLQVALFSFLSTSQISLNNLSLVSFLPEAVNSREVIGGAIEFVNGFTAILKLTSFLSCGEFILGVLKILICPEVQSTNVSNLSLSNLLFLPSSHEASAGTNVVWSSTETGNATTVNLSEVGAASGTAVAIETEENYSQTLQVINASETLQVGELAPEEVSSIQIVVSAEFFATLQPKQLLLPIESLSLGSSIDLQTLTHNGTVAGMYVGDTNHVIVSITNLNVDTNISIVDMRDLSVKATLARSALSTIVGQPLNNLFFGSSATSLSLDRWYILLFSQDIETQIKTYYGLRYLVDNNFVLTHDLSFGTNGILTFSETVLPAENDVVNRGINTIMEWGDNLAGLGFGYPDAFLNGVDQYSNISQFQKSTGALQQAKTVEIEGVKTIVSDIGFPFPLVEPTQTSLLQIPALFYVDATKNVLLNLDIKYMLLDILTGEPILGTVVDFSNTDIFSTNPNPLRVITGSTTGVNEFGRDAIAFTGYAEAFDRSSVTATVSIGELTTGSITSGNTLDLGVSGALVWQTTHTADRVAVLYTVEISDDDSTYKLGQVIVDSGELVIE